MTAEHPPEPADEQRVEREERGRAGRPVVAGLGDQEVPVAVPARPHVDRDAELVEPIRVPGTASRVELRLEEEHGARGERPEREPAPEEDDERRPRCPKPGASRDDTAIGGEGFDAEPGSRSRPWLPSTHEQHQASPPDASACAEAARPPSQAAPDTEAAARSRRPRSAPRRSRRCRGIGGARLRRPLRPRRPETDQDRSELLRLRRRQLAPRGHPGRAEPAGRPARTDLPVAREGHGRDRGPPVLRPRRRRCRRHCPRALARRQGGACGRGRLDDQRSSSSGTSTSRTSARSSGR